MKIKTLLDYFNFDKKIKPEKPEEVDYDIPVYEKNSEKQTETDPELKKMLESKEQENKELIKKNREQLEKDVKEVDENEI